MKFPSFWLLGGALWGALPLAAQPQIPINTTVGGAFSDARKTWREVRVQVLELDNLIEKRGFAEVHDAALGLRDTVRELRFGWSALSAPQKARADDGIRKIDGLLDSLHEHADGNHARGVVKDQRTLHVLLDQIAGAFPASVLAPIGAVAAKRPVKDPMCRMIVDPNTAAASASYAGQTYYFCARSEAAAFRKNPAPSAALYDEIAFGKPRMFGVSVASGAKIEAGRPARLVFAIREQGKSALVTKFQLVHEKKFHLIAVSEDLGWFGHLHPQQAADGRFYLTQRFPYQGRYFLFSDFTPQNGSNTVAHSQIRVGSGARIPSQPLKADRVLFHIVDGIEIKLRVSAPLRAREQALLSYSLLKNGVELQNMTPYLGAMGHLMAVSQDGARAVHTHTVSAGRDPQTGLAVTPQMATAQGPTQTFKLELPSGGLYKIWAQFGVGGKILTVPFTLSVKAPNMNKTQSAALLAASTSLLGATLVASAAPKTQPKPAQKITISLPQGYKTGAATVQKGRPVALTFKLASNAGCGNTVSLPAAKWTKTLEIGQSATVIYTPQKSGPLGFQCGMGHMKGTLTVR